MVYGAIALLVVAVIAILLQVFLMPKPEIEDARPAGLGDFDVPTATEKRAVPVVWGDVKVAGPNVIWYGDLGVRPYRQTEGGNKITISHRYSLGMDLALCHGDDTIECYRIDVGKEKTDVFDGVVMSGVNTYEIDKDFLFGGPEKRGGLQGTLEFYEGSNIAGDVETSQYLADQLTSGVKNEMPAYPNLCHAVWRGPSSGVNSTGALNGYLGTQTTIDNWIFYVRRYPLPADMTIDPGAERIGDDANAICVLFETLTDNVWGAGLPATELDIPAFNAAANQVATDGDGFSLVWQTRRPVRDLVTEVVRTVDAVLFLTSDGKITINLARDTAPVITLDETNIIELRKFTRNAWNATTNHVQIDFKDRDDEFKDTSAAQQDIANYRLQGGIDVSAAQNYPGVKNPSVAQRIAARELRQMSFPLATIELEVNREASIIKPGDNVTFDWPELGITGMIVRVTQIGLGKLDSGSIIISGAEDVFGLGAAIFSAPPATNWAPVLVAPTDVLVEEIVEMPSQLTPNALEAAGDTDDVDFRWVAVGENPGNGFEFTAHSRTDGSSGPFDDWDPAEFPNTEARVQYLGYTATAGLSSVLHAYAGGSQTLASLTVAGLSIDFLERTQLDDPDVAPAGVKTVINADVRAGKSLVLIGTDGGRQEYLTYDTLTDNGDGTVTLGGVNRGMLDTAPWTWPVGTKLFFMGEEMVIRQQDGTPDVVRSQRRVSPALAAGVALDARLAQETMGGSLTPAAATESNPTLSASQPRQTLPAAVGDVLVKVATAAGGAGLGAAANNYTPDSDSLVAGAVRNTIAGVTGSFDLRVSVAHRARRPATASFWEPGDGNEALNPVESTTDPLDPFFTGGVGVTPFRRAAVLVEGIDGGTTTLASGDIDLATATSIDFLALPANGVSNSDTIRITIITERHETGGGSFDSENPYVAVFERVA